MRRYYNLPKDEMGKKQADWALDRIAELEAKRTGIDKEIARLQAILEFLETPIESFRAEAP